MLIDPRTLRAIGEEADCHLIPDCLGLTHHIVAGGGQTTVRLDREFDNRVGGKCDEQLKNYIAAFFSDKIGGKVALESGSKSLSCTYSFSERSIQIAIPESVDLKVFQERALGMKDGNIRIETITSNRADELGALLSVIHSAILVLYQHNEPRVFGPSLDYARELLNKMLDDKLIASDYNAIRCMVSWRITYESRKTAGRSDIPLDEWRMLHDPNFDTPDDILKRFPSNCISTQGCELIVTLPYSRNLRGIVRFALPSIP